MCEEENLNRQNSLKVYVVLLSFWAYIKVLPIVARIQQKNPPHSLLTVPFTQSAGGGEKVFAVFWPQSIETSFVGPKLLGPSHSESIGEIITL